MTHLTCRLTAKHRDQLRNPTLGNRVRATLHNRVIMSNRPVRHRLYLLECGGDPVVAVLAGGGHEGVARVHREADADSDADDDLYGRHGAQRNPPELHETGDAHDHADHRDRDTGDRDWMWDEHQRYEQHSYTQHGSGTIIYRAVAIR